MTDQAWEEEKLLVGRIRNGDRLAFEGLVESYRSKVMATLYNLLGRYQEAEEVFWDVWTEVWKSIHRFKGESKLSTWIYSITTHVAYHRRRSRKGPTVSLDEVELNLPSTSDPEREVMQREESRMVERAIAKLPETLRAPLVLHAISGLDYDAISEILGIPVGALKTRVWRAKVELRKVLQSWMTTEKI